jgi:glycosyltransferase involved in cell wall biosynthesis
VNYLFVLSELPYPASRNGIALINHELLRQAPSDVHIDILITGTQESDEDIDRLRALAPSIGRINFTGEPLSRKYRIGNLLSGAFLGRNLFTQLGLRRHLRQMQPMPDTIYVSPLMAGFDLRLARPIFLNAVDSFARLNKSAYLQTGSFRDWLKMRLYRAYESRALTDVFLINFVSKVDLESVRSNAPSLPLINLSNGVDSSKFSPDEKMRVPGRLLFIGNFDYTPNVEAVRHLVSDIFPLIRAASPTATLQIVGQNPPPEILGEPGVMATGFVEDIVSYYRSAQVFVCPLLSGAGVKNKVLEALSSGLPVVTTSLGVDGIEHLEKDRHYLLADNPREFAERVIAVLSDEKLCASLGEEARAVIARHHGWGPIVNQYFEALKEATINRERIKS